MWQVQNNEWRGYQQLYFEQTGQPSDIRVREIVPAMTGQAERCVTCHMGLVEISAAHPVESFGCISCHGGDGVALKSEQAHQGLRGGKNPSDMLIVEENCGRGCHSGLNDDEQNHVDRVLRSLQGTYTGGITAVRFAFGAQPDETPIYSVYEVPAFAAKLQFID